MFPLRQCRDQGLQYFRALSETYPMMTGEEKHAFVRLVFYEAGKRYVWSLSDKTPHERIMGLRKWELIEKLAVAQEASESGVGHKCKFWSEGALSLVRIQTPGYEACPAYNELKNGSTMEAQYEAVTILSEVSDNVAKTVRQIQDDFRLSNPEQQAQQD